MHTLFTNIMYIIINIIHIWFSAIKETCDWFVENYNTVRK